VRRRWRQLGVQEKLHILIQGSLIVLFLLSVQWVVNRFEMQVMTSAEARAEETADGLINGMNMLMLTGQVSHPENRRLLLSKMSQSKGIRELRMIRGRPVIDQYGPGMPGEQPVDDLDREVLSTGKTRIMKIEGLNGEPMIRVVMPYIATADFRGTNCLSCHTVAPGSVNGAASVLIDLSEEAAYVAEVKRWLWLGHLAIQILLSVIIAVFVRVLIVRHIARPVTELQMAMTRIQQDGDLSRRVNVSEENADIGEMARTFNALLESLQNAQSRLDLFGRVFENSEEAIVITDAERRIVAVNNAFTRITGYAADEVTGKNPKILSSGRQDAEFYSKMWQAINTEGRWEGEIWNRRKSGEIFPEWLSVAVVRNESGQVVNYISLFSDITKRKESEKQIQFLAHYDPLTLLPNRTLFSDRLHQALMASKRNSKRLALLFLDLDRFKGINDSLGHLAGDLLLQSVAERLRACVRETDTICRQGGDEFMILLQEIERTEDVAHVAEKIIAAMSEPHIIEGHHLTVTFSIGISMSPDDGIDSPTLIKNADAAMYHAKERGRNNFQFFAPSMNAEAAERLALEGDLRRAIRGNELFLVYQPQIDNRTEQIIGLEALVRWRHPEQGVIPPGKFIPVAEESGLIIKIGEFVLREACRQNKQWQDEGRFFLPVSVNLSAMQFYQKDIVVTIGQVLQETGLEAKYLELEITEGIAIEEVDKAVLTLKALKNMGVRIAIDDFGVGYSSLSYLKRFPIDKLKIDQSFVRDLSTDMDDAVIVRTIVGMGHSLRLNVIAEGVETAEQLDYLRENSCDEVQGFYFSRPLVPEDVERFVQEHSG
jgi:diguanylate cyclase (GGDEF)-like protein/PAS domain S-box-containing protein